MYDEKRGKNLDASDQRKRRLERRRDEGLIQKGNAPNCRWHHPARSYNLRVEVIIMLSIRHLYKGILQVQPRQHLSFFDIFHASTAD